MLVRLPSIARTLRGRSGDMAFGLTRYAFGLTRFAFGLTHYAFGLTHYGNSIVCSAKVPLTSMIAIA